MSLPAQTNKTNRESSSQQAQTSKLVSSTLGVYNHHPAIAAVAALKPPSGHTREPIVKIIPAVVLEKHERCSQPVQ